jgi:hypothetical protein
VAVPVATMAVVPAHGHVHGEAWSATGRAVTQGTSPVPLIAPATGGLEAEQLEYLLHGDFRTQPVEVDTVHDGSSLGAGGIFV